MRFDLILVNAIHRNYDGSMQESSQFGLLYIATFTDLPIIVGGPLAKVLDRKLVSEQP